MALTFAQQQMEKMQAAARAAELAGATPEEAAELAKMEALKHPARAETAGLISTIRARVGPDDAALNESLEVAISVLREEQLGAVATRDERIARWEAKAAEGKLVELP